MDLEAKNMEEKYKHKIITIPNILSFFRLLLIPVIMWLYIVKEAPVLTTVILALSGITDIVDGIIARKCHMVSDFGKAFANCPNWQLYLLSSHTEFERTFGRMADKKRKLYNGMIKCELFMYFK